MNIKSKTFVLGCAGKTNSSILRKAQYIKALIEAQIIDKVEIKIIENESYLKLIKLESKYEKVLSILAEHYPPCELDGFMDKNIEYCSMNCGVDEEIFKKCWDRYIEQQLIGDKQ